MNFSDFKVGTRLSVGFALLLLITIAVGGVGLMRLSQLDQMVTHITEVNWHKARLTMETEARNRDSAAKFARLLMIDGDSELAKTLKAKIAVNSEGNGAALKELEPLLESAEEKTLFAEASDGAGSLQRVARAGDQAGRGAQDPCGGPRALQLGDGRPDGAVHRSARQAQDDAAGNLRQGQRGERGGLPPLAQHHPCHHRRRGDLRHRAGDPAGAQHRASAGQRRVDRRIHQGRAVSTIRSTPRAATKPAKLLGSLDAMQSALRARDEKDADSRGQIAAIGSVAGGHRIRA